MWAGCWADITQAERLCNRNNILNTCTYVTWVWDPLVWLASGNRHRSREKEAGKWHTCTTHTIKNILRPQSGAVDRWSSVQFWAIFDKQEGPWGSTVAAHSMERSQKIMPKFIEVLFSQNNTVVRRQTSLNHRHTEETTDSPPNNVTN